MKERRRKEGKKATYVGCVDMILQHKGKFRGQWAFCTKLESGLIPNSCSCGLTFVL